MTTSSKKLSIFQSRPQSSFFKTIPKVAVICSVLILCFLSGNGIQILKNCNDERPVANPLSPESFSTVVDDKPVLYFQKDVLQSMQWLLSNNLTLPRLGR